VTPRERWVYQQVRWRQREYQMAVAEKQRWDRQAEAKRQQQQQQHE
jgi:hypothetical protein